jgi:hypothetical protein
MERPAAAAGSMGPPPAEGPTEEDLARWCRWAASPIPGEAHFGRAALKLAGVDPVAEPPAVSPPAPAGSVDPPAPVRV